MKTVRAVGRWMALGIALLAAAGCGADAGAVLRAQEAAGVDDPEVVARRVLDLEAMRVAGKSSVAIAPDLSFALFSRQVDGGGYVLAVQELETGQVRDITEVYASIFPSYYPFSVAPGGEWAVVNSLRSGSADFEHKMIRLDGGEERVLMSFSWERPDRPVAWVEALGWSNDGTRLLSRAEMRDGSVALHIFSREDGSGVLLRAFDWAYPAWAAFSPDGRFVAYDLQAERDNPGKDLYVIPLEGGRERRITSDAIPKDLIGWSPDGSAVYYAVGDREAGTSSVWRLPLRENRAVGAATLVRRDVAGSPWFALKGDRIVYRVRSDVNSVWSATLDLASDRVVTPPVPFVEMRGPFVNGPFFDWSPDGLAFTYVRKPGDGRPGVELVLHPASGDGAERTIRIEGLEYLHGRMPYSDEAILVKGQAPQRPGYEELLRVDLASGEVTRIEDARSDLLREGWAFRADRRLSEDGSTLYLTRESGEVSEIVARDLASGAERTLFRVEPRMTPGASRFNREGPALSPDGTLLAFLVLSDSPGLDGGDDLHLLPVAGGASRVIHTGWIGGATLNWTSDSRSLVFRDYLEQGGSGGQVWKVEVDGGGKTLLFDMPDGLGQLRLSPDDRRVVFMGPGGRRVEELWVLENLPETRGRQAAAASR